MHNIETVKKGFKEVYFDHRNEFASQGKREIVDDGVIHERASGNNAKLSGTDSTELKEYADMYNLDLRDPKVRKAAIEGVLAKRKAEKQME